MNKMDVLWLLGELEHERKHALRAARVFDNVEKDKSFKNIVRAGQAQTMRREIQNFFDISEEEWCQVKVAMIIKQLAYETFEGNIELFKKLEDFTDDILSDALNEDFRGCKSCKEDMNEEEAEKLKI